MLGKMLIHGLVAAALIGSAAAVYAQAKDNGYLKPDAVQAQPAPAGKTAKADDKGVGGYVAAATGYLTNAATRDGDGRHARKEHHRDGRHHDDDDDD